MTDYVSLEESLLKEAESALSTAFRSESGGPYDRLEVLEAAASLLGGFSLSEYRRLFPAQRVLASIEAKAAARDLIPLLAATGMRPSLAIAALARKPVPRAERRAAGAFYTDFRLAEHLAAQMRVDLQRGATIVDPAAGTGTLLAACVLVACGEDREQRARFIRRALVAADRDSHALRGLLITISSLTHDLTAVKAMSTRLKCWDSLLASTTAWRDALPNTPVVVVANPPWEKIKLSRHEYLVSKGHRRHYGAAYEEFDADGYRERSDAATAYGDALAAEYPLIGSGEPDLYKAFMELFVRLASEDGALGAFVPAGLIRSQGTENLRKLLVGLHGDLSLEVFENRARFFAIDSRFKFLLVRLRRARRSRPVTSIALATGSGTETGVQKGQVVELPIAQLRRLRSDLTIPEVRTTSEWRLFEHLNRVGEAWSEDAGPWACDFAREVDMTRDRSLFLPRPGAGRIPLIEGRMVHQHHFGAKSYIGGTGRKATWVPSPLGHTHLAPQYWVLETSLPENVRNRASHCRVGFCDVTGQTNERSLLAALVPPGVVCGNKVPTIRFVGMDGQERLLVWLAIANSLVFDWLLRRVISTSVNYFLLRSVPLPRLESGGLPWQRLVEHAQQLMAFGAAGGRVPDMWDVGRVRATIDALVARAYQLTLPDLELILADFPLLDRGQPALPGERVSTITRDAFLCSAAEVCNEPSKGLQERIAAGKRVGSVPYMPSEFARTSLRLKEAREAPIYVPASY